MPGDGQRHKAAEERHRTPAQLLGRHAEPKPGQPAEKRRQRDLRLEPREWRAEAEVAAASEAEVASATRSREIELARRLEPLGIVVGRAKDDDHRLAATNRLAAELDVLHRPAVQRPL